MKSWKISAPNVFREKAKGLVKCCLTRLGWYKEAGCCSSRHERMTQRHLEIVQATSPRVPRL